MAYANSYPLRPNYSPIGLMSITISIMFCDIGYPRII